MIWRGIRADLLVVTPCPLIMRIIFSLSQLCLFSFSRSPAHFFYALLGHTHSRTDWTLCWCVCACDQSRVMTDRNIRLKAGGRLTVYRSEGLWLLCDRFNFILSFDQSLDVSFGARTLAQRHCMRAWDPPVVWIIDIIYIDALLVALDRCCDTLTRPPFCGGQDCTVIKYN